MGYYSIGQADRYMIESLWGYMCPFLASTTVHVLRFRTFSWYPEQRSETHVRRYIMAYPFIGSSSGMSKLPPTKTGVLGVIAAQTKASEH